MSAREVVLVSTGVANAASVRSALARAGAAVREARDAEDVLAAERVVLPGVGAFGAARAELARRGLDQALALRARDGRPTLGICLGMQLFARSSAESPLAAGLGLIDGAVEAFEGGPTVPQLGWNQIEPGPLARLVEQGYAWFANSYRLGSAPSGWAASLADHGGPFVAALERGDVLLCQFHPELSGAWGAGLIGRWLRRGGGRC